MPGSEGTAMSSSPLVKISSSQNSKQPAASAMAYLLFALFCRSLHAKALRESTCDNCVI